MNKARKKYIADIESAIGLLGATANNLNICLNHNDGFISDACETLGDNAMKWLCGFGDDVIPNCPREAEKAIRQYPPASCTFTQERDFYPGIKYRLGDAVKALKWIVANPEESDVKIRRRFYKAFLLTRNVTIMMAFAKHHQVQLRRDDLAKAA